MANLHRVPAQVHLAKLSEDPPAQRTSTQWDAWDAAIGKAQRTQLEASGFERNCQAQVMKLLKSMVEFSQEGS